MGFYSFSTLRAGDSILNRAQGFEGISEFLEVAPAECAAQRTIISKLRRSPVEFPIQVHGDRDLITQKRSPNVNLPIYRCGTREKSDILSINTPIFLTPPQEQV